MQTINKWLEAIGMGRYAKNFIEQGFATPRQILLLTIDDLETLGVGSVEHQKKIHRAIINTKAQVKDPIELILFLRYKFIFESQSYDKSSHRRDSIKRFS